MDEESVDGGVEDSAGQAQQAPHPDHADRFVSHAWGDGDRDFPYRDAPAVVEGSDAHSWSDDFGDDGITRVRHSHLWGERPNSFRRPDATERVLRFSGLAAFAESVPFLVSLPPIGPKPWD